MDSMLAADVALLALDDETGRPLVDDSKFAVAITAAVVVDQILIGTLKVEDSAEVRRERRFVSTATTASDPLLSEVISLLEGMPLKKGIEKVHGKLGGKLAAAVREALVASGDLQEQRRKVLGLFPQTNHPAGNPAREADARARLTAALDGPLPPDQRTTTLLGILSSADILGKVFPGRDKKQTKARIAELTKGDWAGEATKDVIEALEAAAMVPVIIAASM